MKFSQLLLISVLSLLVLGGSGRAQTLVEGVTDEKVYANHVSFVVHSEEGFEVSGELNGDAIATDVPVEVDRPDYYELSVIRRELSTGTEESELIQFIVRDSARGNSEWGLPPWTPYPSIDSAAAEFAGARLKIVAPAQYPMGLDIPVIARVEDESGKRLGVNGAIIATYRMGNLLPMPIEPNDKQTAWAGNLPILRGVGSVFLPPASEPGVISYTAAIHSLENTTQVEIEASTTWQTIDEDIVASTDWGQNARIHISGVADDVLTIPSDVTLTIGAGSVILIDPDIDIIVEGSIVVNGTLERPVVFTTPDRNVPWGGFLFEEGASQGAFTGAILTASGADSNWLGHHPGYGHSHRDEQCLFFLCEGADVTLTDCFIVENHGQAGHGERAYLTMTGCLVQKCITAGQYNRGSVVLNDCALIEFPSAAAAFADNDNDALYLTGGTHALTDCLIGWALDDGIDAGSGTGGSVTVEGCWFESCYHEAMAFSEPRDANVADTVVLNCGQGIECGFGSPDVNAIRCLATANAVGARFGDNYDWSYRGFLSVSDCLLLFNKRDVWGRAWDNWTVHLSQMDIQNNYFSAPNANYPHNQLWDPQNDPNQLDRLAPFLPTDAATVGLGLATGEDVQELSELAGAIPVRLSTFTVQVVSVDYAVDADAEPLDSGTLYFTPGETVEHIRFDTLSAEDAREIHLTLSDPINAELTGRTEITYRNSAAFVEPLIVKGDVWQYFKGTEEPPAGWNTLSFNDTNWLSGSTPIGYESSSGYEAHLATDLTDMRNGYLSVYARREFIVEDPSRLTGLTLTVDFDDGYIGYINGVQVSDQGAPNPPVYDQPASASNEACCGRCDPEETDLTGHLDTLAPGVNVLAIQAHNRSLSSSDFLFTAELSAVTGP